MRSWIILQITILVSVYQPFSRLKTLCNTMMRWISCIQTILTFLSTNNTLHDQIHGMPGIDIPYLILQLLFHRSKLQSTPANILQYVKKADRHSWILSAIFHSKYYILSIRFAEVYIVYSGTAPNQLWICNCIKHSVCIKTFFSVHVKSMKSQSFPAMIIPFCELYPNINIAYFLHVLSGF